MPPLRECREDIPLIAGEHPRSGSRAQNGVRAPRALGGGAASSCAATIPRQRARAGEHPRARDRALGAASEIERRRPAPAGRRAAEPAAARGAARASGAPLPDYLDRVEREAILAGAGARPASTAPRRRSCSASPSARCATGCSGSASTSRARMADESLADVAGRCAARTVAELRQPPAGSVVDLLVLHSISLPPGEFGGDAIERLFTNRLDPAAHPVFRGARRPARVGAFPDPPRRRAGAVRAARARAPGTPARRAGAAASAATTSPSASSSKAPTTARSPSRAVRSARVLCCENFSARLPLARSRRPQRRRARPQDRSRARASTGRACSRRSRSN